jgi:pimeloyl-ACP methyl ester carboxylesterase
MSRAVHSSDGVPIAYDVHGSGTPAVVLVHGWSCDRSYWREQVDHLAASHTVVRLDLAGHGSSGVSRADWTIESLAADVVAVVERLDLEHVVLVGHSLGGDVVTLAAAPMPARVVGVVWVDTYRSLGGPDDPDELARFVDRFRRDFHATTSAYVRGFFPHGADPQLVDWVVSDMASQPPAIALPLLDAAVHAEPEIIEALSQPRAPVVALNAGYKPNDPASLAAYGVDLVVVPEAGHMLMLEDPATFNRLLDGILDRFGNSL